MDCRWQIDFFELKKGAWGPIGVSAERWLEKDFKRKWCFRLYR